MNRIDKTKWPKRVLEWQPTGRRKREALALTWQKYIN